jgi:hypothetical protein
VSSSSVVVDDLHAREALRMRRSLYRGRTGGDADRTA